MTTASRFCASLLIFLVRVYQRVVSPLLGPSCRFQPTCSHYAVACLSTHGPWRGSWLAVKRIARCHPFNPGGYDPPPGHDPDTTPQGHTPSH